MRVDLDEQRAAVVLNRDELLGIIRSLFGRDRHSHGPHVLSSGKIPLAPCMLRKPVLIRDRVVEDFVGHPVHKIVKADRVDPGALTGISEVHSLLRLLHLDQVAVVPDKPAVFALVFSVKLPGSFAVLTRLSFCRGCFALGRFCRSCLCRSRLCRSCLCRSRLCRGCLFLRCRCLAGAARRHHRRRKKDRC